MDALLKKLNPSVNKNSLLILAAVVWCAVGIMLCNIASEWLSKTTAQNALLLGLAGLILSLFIHHFGFLKLVKKNTERILSVNDRVCIFAFQPWKSYITIVIMITLGFALRHSNVPRTYLAIIYIGFGVAMLLSSLKYLWIFFQIRRKM